MIRTLGLSKPILFVMPEFTLSSSFKLPYKSHRIRSWNLLHSLQKFELLALPDSITTRHERALLRFDAASRTQIKVHIQLCHGNSLLYHHGGGVLDKLVDLRRECRRKKRRYPYRCSVERHPKPAAVTSTHSGDQSNALWKGATP
jgi:hypothetical protein